MASLNQLILAGPASSPMELEPGLAGYCDLACCRPAGQLQLVTRMFGTTAAAGRTATEPNKASRGRSRRRVCTKEPLVMRSSRWGNNTNRL